MHRRWCDARLLLLLLLLLLPPAIGRFLRPANRMVFQDYVCWLSVSVPRAYGDESIHAQSRIPFVFQEHRVTRASMPKA